MTQYLQGVSDDSPLEAGLAFVPVTAAAFAAASVTSRLSRRLGNERLAVAGVAAMLVGTAWTSRVGPDTAYLAGIALPMLIFGVGQGLGLSALTTGGMAGVAAQDAGVAGGLVNVAHLLGGALGLGVLVTVFDAAGTAGDGPPELLAHRVAAALTAATAFLVLALLVTLIARRRRVAATRSVDDLPSAPDLTAADAGTLARTAA
jgi:MFS family permease